MNFIYIGRVALLVCLVFIATTAAWGRGPFLRDLAEREPNQDGMELTAKEQDENGIPGYPKRYQDSERSYDEELDLATKVKGAPGVTAAEEILPEVQNYNLVVQPFWSVTYSSGRKKRSIGNDRDGKESYSKRWGHGGYGGGRWRRLHQRSEELVLLDVKLLGSETELKLYDSSDSMRDLMASPVIQAELYERPLASDVSKSVSTALGGKQRGVAVTLSDGRRLFFVKGNQKGRGKETTIILWDHVTDDWVKTATKDVRGSTVKDFYVAGGRHFDLLKDNGNQAAARMMELP